MKYSFKIIMLILIVLNSHSLIYSISLSDDDLSSFSDADADTYPPATEDAETTNPRKFMKDKFETIKSSLPERNWYVEVKVPGFYIAGEKPFQKGTGVKITATNPMNKMTIVVILEQTTRNGDYLTCRDYFNENVIQKIVPEKTNLKNEELDDRAIMEFIIPKTEDNNINQKNLFVFMTKDDVWIFIQAYKNDYVEDDDNSFSEIKENIKIIHKTEEEMEAETSKGKVLATINSNEALKNYVDGSRLYEEFDYQKAIELLQKSLDLEKENPTFTQSNEPLRKLIENLASSYGVLGITDKGKEVLSYGISKDPEYSLFYYIYARLTAAKLNLQDTLSYLTMAYDCEIRNNTNFLPDPRSEVEFQTYLKNDKFIELLDKYKK